MILTNYFSDMGIIFLVQSDGAFVSKFTLSCVILSTSSKYKFSLHIVVSHIDLEVF